MDKRTDPAGAMTGTAERHDDPGATQGATQGATMTAGGALLARLKALGIDYIFANCRGRRR